MPKINKKILSLKKIKVNYSLEGPKKPGAKKRERREGVKMFIKPVTHEINKWLAVQGWASPLKCNPGRGVDHYTRRYWQLYISKDGSFPPNEWSTAEILDDMLNEIKQGNLLPFPDVDLISKPLRGRLIDYLARYWYMYENGQKNPR